MENGNIIIYESNDGAILVDVRLEKETVWLSQAQMAELFQKDRTVIGRHISNVFKEGELDENVVCAKFAHTCHIIHGDEAHVVSELARAEKTNMRRNLLAGKRIGVVGEPSEWLILSGVDREAAKKRWGFEFVDIPLDEVVAEFERIDDDAPIEDASKFIHEAAAVREPSPGAVLKACRLYYALKSICARHRLDAFTIQCFSLIPRIGTTGCLALALLNDAGIPAGCEGDMQTIFTMLLARELVRSPGFMCNPSHIDLSANEIQLAHCTVGLRQCSSYIIRDHFESHSGVAIQGEMPKGT